MSQRTSVAVLLVFALLSVAFPTVASASDSSTTTRLQMATYSDQIEAALSPSTLNLDTTLVTSAAASTSAASEASSTSSVDFSSLSSALSTRKALMLGLAQTDPFLFLQSVLSASDRAHIPAQFTSDVEQPVTVTGTLEVLTGDNSSDSETSTLTYKLATTNGTLDFYPTRPLDSAPGGTFTVSGYQLDNTLVDNGMASNLQLLSPLAVATSSTVGTQNILVIPVRFSNSTGPYLLPAQLSTDIFGRYFPPFYQEQSYGQLTWAGTVTSWVLLPGNDPGSAPGCSVGSSVSLNTPAVQSYILSHRINLSGYRGVLFLLPDGTDGCSFVGQAPQTVNGATYTLSTSWVGIKGMGATGENMHYNNFPFLYTSVDNLLSHELGHALGLNHSHGLDCGNVAIRGLTDKCTTVEYGNPFDTMATGLYSLDFNSFYKDQLGWFKPTTSTTIQAAGTYRIIALEKSAGRMVARILNPALTALGVHDTPYYLEYRQGLGYDANLKNAAFASTTKGILIENAVVSNVYGLSVTKNANLIDASPTTATWSIDGANPALLPGKIFSDPGRGISISIATTSKGNATTSPEFTVTYSKPICNRSTDYVAINDMSTQVLPGDNGYIAMNITDHDSAGCGTTSYTPVVSAPAGWNIKVDPPVKLAPDDIGFMTVNFIVPSNATPGNYSIGLTYHPAAINQVSMTETITVLKSAAPAIGMPMSPLLSATSTDSVSSTTPAIVSTVTTTDLTATSTATSTASN